MALKFTIKDQIATDPFERGGVQWARVQQEPFADHLNVAVKTLHRWTGTPPFQREVARNGGRSQPATATARSGRSVITASTPSADR